MTKLSAQQEQLAGALSRLKEALNLKGTVQDPVVTSQLTPEDQSAALRTLAEIERSAGHH